MKAAIFYSWQANLPNSTNRGFIESALKEAVEDLKKDDEVVIEPVIDRDTAGVAGAPDIGITIFAKIDAAAAFLCDVSLVTTDESARPMPNPNVLIELGYALKALGHGRIVMVMNTAFGGPDKLPFDLKQKRITTYELEKGKEKTDARKLLRGKLAAGIKEILREQQEDAARVAATPALSDVTIQAIRQGQPNQVPAAERFMKWLAGELKALGPKDLPGDPAENLIAAIEKTAGLVDEFGRVAEAVAEMNSAESAHKLFKGFEHVLALYDAQPGYTGAFSDRDFELYKFVGHEICSVLFAFLLQAGRWDLTLKGHSTQPDRGRWRRA